MTTAAHGADGADGPLTSLPGTDRPPERLDGFVDCCCLLDPRHLVVSGWAFHPDSPVTLSLSVDGAPTSRADRVEIVRGQRPDVSRAFDDTSGRPWGYIVVARLDQALVPGAEVTLRLEGRSHRREIELAPRSLPIEQVEQHLTSFTVEERQAVDAAFRGLPGVTPPAPTPPPPPAPPRPELGLKELAVFIRAHIEDALLIPGQGVFLQGWLFDREGALVSLHARIGGVTGDNMLHTLGRFHRDDVAHEFQTHPDPGQPPGIIAFIPLDVASDIASLELLFVTRDGEVARLEVTPRRLHGTARTVLPRMLGNFTPGAPQAFSILERHLGPAVAAAWKVLRSAPIDPVVRDFGRLPDRPTYSVIVPLFGRADFLRYQLATLCHDAEMAETELVYVVDDPDIYGEAVQLGRELSPLFDTALRLVYPGRNLGFAGACNLGVRRSKGRYVVLLNSDVLPRDRGWLGRLAARHRALDDAGPIAPRLVYPDGTIQHDGIVFRPHPSFDGLVLNEHLGKGLPTWLAASRSDSPLEVPAVSAACLMILRRQYDELGGLDEDYVFGDFEDSDLCLKARRAGYVSYVVRDEVLYHLERQSVPKLGDPGWRWRVTLYNAWRHQRRWSPELSELTSQGAPTLCPGAPPTSGLSE